jgi:hypothetical protein
VSIGGVPDKVAALSEGCSYVEDVPSLCSTARRNPGYEDMERSRSDTRRMATLPDWTPELALDDIRERMISYVREQRADSAGSP